ncbi:MAG: hypothetical protein WAP23_03180 [Candidatus Spechtbacterales bacterium]
MLSPFVKSQIADAVMMVMLAVFTAFLWLDLRVIREEIGAMRAERDFLALKVKEIRKNAESTRQKVSGIRIVRVSAYSSTPDQTDDTPFITASGTEVRDGVAAANFLPFGTKIKLQDAFGEKTFIVEDRMKRDGLVDVWFPTREAALAFGVRNLKMEILSN